MKIHAYKYVAPGHDIYLITPTALQKAMAIVGQEGNIVRQSNQSLV